MIEIIFLVYLCSRLGRILRAKGRKPLLMQVMLITCWFFGEISGGFIAGVVHVIRNGEQAPLGFGVYAFAICGAVAGAGFTFLLAHLLPSQNSQPQMMPSQDPFEHRPRDPSNPYAP
jgi:hypothetical protein